MNFAFIDPSALSALSFETIRKLAGVHRMDMLIHFPTADIKRNFGRNARGLTRFLGTDAWRAVAQSAADVVKLIPVLTAQLATLGYTGKRVQPATVTQSTNVPLYHLVFATKHSLGDKIWKSIVKTTARGERGFGF